jgi:predicted DNA-binding protein
MLNIDISKDLEGRLHKMAQKMHKDESYVVKKAIRTFVADMEDYYLGLMALKEHKRSKKSEGSTIWTLEDLDREIATLDVES